MIFIRDSVGIELLPPDVLLLYSVDLYPRGWMLGLLVVSAGL
jgi:hypothetical protein